MNAEGFTRIPNSVLRTLMDGTDCKTAIVLALESRRGYSDKGLPLALLEHEVAINEEPRPRRTFETALKCLLEGGQVVKAGTRYYSASVLAEKAASETRQPTRQDSRQDLGQKTRQPTRQDSRQKAAKTPPKKAVQHKEMRVPKEGKAGKEGKEVKKAGSQVGIPGEPPAPLPALPDVSNLVKLTALLGTRALERFAQHLDVTVLEGWEGAYSPEFLALAWKLAPTNSRGKSAVYAFQGWLEREAAWPWPEELRALWDKPTEARASSPPGSRDSPASTANGAAYTVVSSIPDAEIDVPF